LAQDTRTGGRNAITTFKGVIAMQKRTKTLLGSTTLAGLAALAPLTMDLGAPARGESPVRLNQACGQSGTCVLAAGYVCFVNDVAYFNVKCSSGCGS
jgi:hypothetical protein